MVTLTLVTTFNLETIMTNTVNQNCKILLVEDEKVVMYVHTTMLHDLGFTPDTAETGMAALALCQNEYDLIFMDIGLPDINGIEVTTRIRECEQAKNNIKRPSIVALTAYEIHEVYDECMKAGMDEVANKPITKDRLMALIQKHIDQIG